jgi:Na+-translocating ferredoxin:NAD+ oxidoreductase RnfA subunit
MTRTTNARIAGFTYLLYIAVAFPSILIFAKATRGDSIALQLARIAEHASDIRLTVVLSLISCFCALVLAVTLYNITRDQDPDIAMLGLTCRVAEGVVGGVSVPGALGLLWLANAPDPAAANTLGAFLLKSQDWNMTIAATFFAVGSTAFAYLLLRGRIVPVALAWLGVLASIVVVIGLPLQIIGSLPGPVIQMMWYPMLAFEVSLAFWLLIKGAAMPTPRLTMGIEK